MKSDINSDVSNKFETDSCSIHLYITSRNISSFLSLKIYCMSQLHKTNSDAARTKRGLKVANQIIEQGDANIDRHLCKRVAPMQVLSLRLSRTGTLC